MSIDFQFISVVDDLQVTSVEDIEGAEPRTLRLVTTGGFNSAQRVLINDYAVDTFLVSSDRVILVEIGDLFEGSGANELRIVVVASALTGTRKVRLLFGPTRRTRKVSGIQKLVQQIVKVLLTDTGTNRFNIVEGGDLVRALGTGFSLSQRSRVSTILARAIDNTETQILAAQASVRNLPANERLLSLSLERVVFLESAGEVQAEIRLATFAGQALNIPLVL